MAAPRSFVVEPITHEPVRGIVLMIFAVCTFSLLDTTAKYLVQSYPLGQVVWARYVGHVVLAAALLLPLHGRGLLVTQRPGLQVLRSEEHTSELQSLMRISYAVFCLKTKN